MRLPPHLTHTGASASFCRRFPHLFLQPRPRAQVSDFYLPVWPGSICMNVPWHDPSAQTCFCICVDNHTQQNQHRNRHLNQKGGSESNLLASRAITRPCQFYLSLQIPPSSPRPLPTLPWALVILHLADHKNLPNSPSWFHSVSPALVLRTKAGMAYLESRSHHRAWDQAKPLAMACWADAVVCPHILPRLTVLLPCSFLSNKANCMQFPEFHFALGL